MRIVVFEVADDAPQAADAREKWEQALIKLDFSFAAILAFKKMEKIKELVFIDSTIPQILFGQILQFVVPKFAVSKFKGYSVPAKTTKRQPGVLITPKQEIRIMIPPDEVIDVVGLDPAPTFSSDDDVVRESAAVKQQVVWSEQLFFQKPRVHQSDANFLHRAAAEKRAASKAPAWFIEFGKYFDIPMFGTVKQLIHQIFNYHLLHESVLARTDPDKALAVYADHDRYRKILLENKRQTFRFWKLSLEAKLRQDLSKQKYSREYKDLSAKDRKIIDDIIAMRSVSKALEGQRLLRELRVALRMRKATDVFERNMKYHELKTLDNVESILKDHVCVHSLFAASVELQNWTNFVERSTNVRRQLLEQFGQPVIGEIRCRVCGELFEENGSGGLSIGTAQTYTEDYDDFYTQIHEEMTSAVVRYVVFEKAYRVQLDEVINIATDLIYNNLSKKKHALAKSRTLTTAGLRSLLSVFSCIYIFAFLAHFIFVNDSVNFAPLAQTLLARRAHGGKNDSLEKQIKHKIDTGKDRLERIINQALSFIMQLKRLEIEESDYFTDDKVKQIFIETYRWVYGLKHVQTEEVVVKQAWTDVSTPITRYFTSYPSVNVLGRPIDQIVKETETISIYETMKVPDSAHGYHKDLLELIYYNISNKLSRQRCIPASTEYQHYYKTARALSDREKKLYVYNKGRYYSSVPIQSRDRSIWPSDLKKLDCRCKKYKVEFEGKTYAAADFVPGAYKGKYSCAQCANKLRQNPVLADFYAHYTNSCPEGDLHEYGDLGCKKCGVTQEMIDALEPIYFKKYRKTYTANRTEFIEEVAESIAKSYAPRKPTLVEPTNPKITSQQVQEVAREFKIPINLLNNIGLVRKLPLAKIEKNQLNPFVEASEETLRVRNELLVGHYLSLIRFYYYIKNSEFIVNLPENIAALLKGVNNKDFHKMKPIMPDFLDVYHRMIKHTERDKSIYLLNGLCTYILEINSALKRDIAAAMINDLIAAEKNATEYFIKLADAEPIAPVFLEPDEMPDIKEEDEDEPVPFSTADLDMEKDEDGEDENLLHDLND